MKTWVLSKFDIKNFKERTYKSAKEFQNNYGLQFMPNGKLVLKENITWCPSGNDKINFEIINGKWKRISDSVITTSWRKKGEKLLILKLTENELTVRKIAY